MPFDYSFTYEELKTVVQAKGFRYSWRKTGPVFNLKVADLTFPIISQIILGIDNEETYRSKKMSFRIKLSQ